MGLLKLVARHNGAAQAGCQTKSGSSSWLLDIIELLEPVIGHNWLLLPLNTRFVMNLVLIACVIAGALLVGVS